MRIRLRRARHPPPCRFVLLSSGHETAALPTAFAAPQVREALAAHPVGGQLIVTASLFSAVSAVLATPALAVEWLHLAPHATAPRAPSLRAPCWTGGCTAVVARRTAHARRPST